MLKEFRYLIFIFIILIFLFFVGRFYFSDMNIKNSHRSFNNIDKKIKIFAGKLPILESDTQNIIEYVEQSDSKKRKKFKFWKLLDNNE